MIAKGKHFSVNTSKVDTWHETCDLLERLQEQQKKLTLAIKHLNSQELPPYESIKCDVEKITVSVSTNTFLAKIGI